MFDVMEEDQKSKGGIGDSAFGDMLTESYSDIKKTCPSPVSPTSAPPELIELREYANVSYSEPLLLPLRLQAVEKCLSFHILPHVSAQGPCASNKKRRAVDEPNEEIQERKSIKESTSIAISGEPIDSKPLKRMPKSSNSETNVSQQTRKAAAASLPLPPPPPPSNRPPPAIAAPLLLSNSTSDVVAPPPSIVHSKGSVLLPPPPTMPENGAAQPPLPPTVQSLQPAPPANGAAPPPPPLIPHSKGSAPLQPPAIPLAKGAAPPPPPPFGAGKSLRPKKAGTKLKRSTHMGNMYRVLKRKLEGSNLNVYKSKGKGTQVGASAGGKQGMADALAEMAKRYACKQP